MDWLVNHWDGIMTILNAIGLFLINSRKADR